MAICASQDASNAIVVDTSSTPPNCAEYALLDNLEYQQFTEAPTLQDIFNVPLTADVQALWMAGFSLPVIIYLTSWALSVVVNFINSK